jgi:hypothetical protein
MFNAMALLLKSLSMIVVPVLGVAILMGAYLAGEADRAGAPGQSDPGRFVRAEGEDLRVEVGPPGANRPSRVYIRDDDGDEILTVSRLENGSISLSFGSPSARTSALVRENGAISFGTTSARNRLTILGETGADGSAMLQVTNVMNQVLGRFRITPEGHPVEESRPGR